MANPDQNARSSGRVQNAALYRSARPDYGSGFANAANDVWWQVQVAKLVAVLSMYYRRDRNAPNATVSAVCQMCTALMLHHGPGDKRCFRCLQALLTLH
jgi:hypothetical protein